METERKEKVMSFKNVALIVVLALVLGLSGYLLYELYNQNQLLQTDLAKQNARISQFEQELTQKGERVQTQQITVEKLNAEIKKLTADNKLLTDEKSKLNDDIVRMKEDFTQKLNDLQKEKSKVEKKVRPLEQQIAKLKSELKELKSQSPLPAN